MGRQPFISHAVNGYSRYDVPESKAFTCTPGILYPVRIDFINARDRVSIEQGVDVRSNPLAVPTFNPYTIRLHRFWVPLQLYHPELRTNSSKFDMNDLSLNWIVSCQAQAGSLNRDFFGAAYTNSLMSWLRIANKYTVGVSSVPSSVSLPAGSSIDRWSNADSYLAYWDIVRNYYSYSQWGIYSFAWPMANKLVYYGSAYSLDSENSGDARFFTQCFGSLEFLDAYFESQFYPSALASTNNTFNRGNLFTQIICSDLDSGSASGNGFPVSSTYPSTSLWGSTGITSQTSPVASTAGNSSVSYFITAHPMAVVPSNPDRFSRLIPAGSASAVSMSGVSTIPQLAIASRLQEYKDLLGAGGSLYSDWLETFFASKIEHIDRPKLLFSASQTVNVQVVMNQAGFNNFGGDSSTGPLGQQGGAIAFNDRLGRRQSYYFREPGYMIDMLSIRPVYYWSFIKPDYLNYLGSDYFNPIYNDIGFQDIPAFRLAFNGNPGASSANEPCFNEFRSSYDEVLGQLQAYSKSAAEGGSGRPLYSYWVQQRTVYTSSGTGSLPEQHYYPLLFVDMKQVNSPFLSDVEDNFFVNMSYSVQKKSLINKTFATRLSNR
nr:MAG TPA: Major capsid protein [Microviridae sp.]